MSLPDIAPRPATRTPVAVVAAAAFAFVGVLPLLYLALVIWALGGLDADSVGDRAWALVPLAAAVGQVVGGVRLLRRRGWRLLAVSCLPATAFVGWLAAQAVAGGDPISLVSLVLLLGSPVVALVLVLLPQVRHWAGARPGAGGTSGT
jgi:hypothetical protein